MIKFRDEFAKKNDLDLIVHINQEGVKQGIGPFTHGSAVHTDIMKTICHIWDLIHDLALIFSGLENYGGCPDHKIKKWSNHWAAHTILAKTYVFFVLPSIKFTGIFSLFF